MTAPEREEIRRGPGGLVRGVRRSARSGGVAIADQVFSSGTQLLLIVSVAHRSSATILGAVSVCMVVHGFFLGAEGSLVGDVVLIRCRRPGADIAREARHGLTMATAFGLACGVCIALGGVAAGGDLEPFLLLFAVAAPIVHAQDLLRSAAYGARRVGTAMVLDGVWFGVQVAVSVGLLIAGRATATGLVVAWIAGAAASLAVGWVGGRYRPNPRAIAGWMRANGARGLGFLGDFAVSTGVVQLAFLALGAVLSLAEFGTFRLAYVAINPLANLLAGVRSLNLGRLADSVGDRDQARAKARRAAFLFAAIAVAYGAVVTLAPTAVGKVAFGPTWASARSLVGVVALGEVFRLTGFPAIDFVKVFGTARLLVRTRMVTSTVLVAAIVTGGVVDGPRGAVWGMATAMILATIVWWRFAVPAVRGAHPTTTT